MVYHDGGGGGGSVGERENCIIIAVSIAQLLFITDGIELHYFTLLISLSFIFVCVQNLAKAIGLEDPLVCQSMYIFKVNILQVMSGVPC